MSAACSTVCGGAFVSDGGSTTADVEFIMIISRKDGSYYEVSGIKEKAGQSSDRDGDDPRNGTERVFRIF
jgi:hypothetical protein